MSGSRQLPWFPWYPSDFLGAVRGWSTLERGGYRDALDAQWTLGGLPADPKEVRKVIGVTAREFLQIWPKIEPKFPVDQDGLRRNPRLSREQSHGRELSDKRAAIGRKGAQSRWGADGNSSGNSHNAPDGNSQQFANGKTMPSTSTSTSTSTPKPPESERAASPLPAYAVSAALEAKSDEVMRLRDDGLAPAAIAKRMRKDWDVTCNTAQVLQLIAKARGTS